MEPSVLLDGAQCQPYYRQVGVGEGDVARMSSDGPVNVACLLRVCLIRAAVVRRERGG
jgi:hypothetical protein